MLKLDFPTRIASCGKVEADGQELQGVRSIRLDVEAGEPITAVIELDFVGLIVNAGAEITRSCSDLTRLLNLLETWDLPDDVHIRQDMMTLIALLRRAIEKTDTRPVFPDENR